MAFDGSGAVGSSSPNFPGGAALGLRARNAGAAEGRRPGARRLCEEADPPQETRAGLQARAGP
ncbi:hypothetical protein NGM37_34840, partial [Streptomyces sp. TRM76130]|nr:hypothetical protein [Streptomyces sp. TRM76130]